MIGPIVAAADEFTHGLPIATMRIFHEVPFTAGVPDVVIASFNDTATRARLDDDLGPVTSPTHMRALDAVAAGPTSLHELANITGLSPAHLRRTVLPSLVEAGWIELSNRSTVIVPLRVHEPLVQWIVTVEAKRSAWATAVAQARRHLLAADRAFVAIDARHARRAVATAPELARQGIGVATVVATAHSNASAPGGAAVVAYPDVRRPGLPAVARHTRPVDRRLVAERLWELRLRGVESGPTYPVFGRDLTA